MHEAGDPSDPKGYYRALGLEPGASMAAVRAAWRRLAREHHPDAGGDEGRFHHLLEAYETLSDPMRRMAYDRDATGNGEVGPGPSHRPSSPPPHGHLRRARRERRWALLLGLGGLAVVGIVAVVTFRPALEARLAALFAPPVAGDAEPVATAVPTGGRTAPRAETDPAEASPRSRSRVAAPPVPAAARAPTRRPLYEATLRFEPGRWRLADLDPARREAAFEGLAAALAPVAGERWWVEVEASSPRAVRDGRAAVDDWELALLRLAAVLEELTRRRVPAERLGAGFRAGATADLGGLGTVRLRLYCCRDARASAAGSRVETATGASTPRSR